MRVRVSCSAPVVITSGCVPRCRAESSLKPRRNSVCGYPSSTGTSCGRSALAVRVRSTETGADPQALAALLADRPTGEVLTDEEYRDAYEAWDKRWENLLWNPDRTAGAICLCHEGCAYRVPCQNCSHMV